MNVIRCLSRDLMVTVDSVLFTSLQLQENLVDGSIIGRQAGLVCVFIVCKHVHLKKESC